MKTLTSTAPALQNCLDLTTELACHEEATALFQELRDQISGDQCQTAELLNSLWEELLRIQRSAILWQQSCTLERELSERMASSHYQLHQNYLRLLQEQ
jgi:hypothetical protein